MVRRMHEEARVLFAPPAFWNTILGFALIPGIVAVVALLVAVSLPVSLPVAGYYAARHYSATARALCPPVISRVAALAPDQRTAYPMAVVA